MAEQRRSTFETPYKFNGKELDANTDLYYYGARYYDPRVSNWLSVDPLAESTMTPYQYTYQNPINLTDPKGMTAEPPTDFLNKKTGEKVHIDDGFDQTIEINNDQDWSYVTDQISNIQNGFMDGGYIDFLGKFNAIQNPGKNLPPFPILKGYYPEYGPQYENNGVSESDFGKMAGGKVKYNINLAINSGNTEGFTNSCTLRTTYTLTEAGERLPFVNGRGNSTSDRNGFWLYPKVSTLRTQLTKIYGPPNVVSSNINYFKGLKGIIIFDTGNMYLDATGHATLWDGNRALGGNHDYIPLMGTRVSASLWVTP